MPRPTRPLPSISTASTPLRARCAATIVPENPPPTIATGFDRSDFIVGPCVRVRCAGFALHHVVVQSDDGPTCGLREPARYNRMNDACRACADQLGADLDCSRTVACPCHPKGMRVCREEVSGS